MLAQGCSVSAVARIKCIKPSAKVIGVEALPWWQRAPLDPCGACHNDARFTEVSTASSPNLRRCDILGISYIIRRRRRPLALLAGPHRRGRTARCWGAHNPGRVYK